MKSQQKDLIKYRLERAKTTLDDARILADQERWNSTINRLYYSAYYEVIALLLKSGLKPTTHKGVKAVYSEYFIKTGKFPKEFGKFIRNSSHGDKRVIMMICLILKEKKSCLILSQCKG